MIINTKLQKCWISVDTDDYYAVIYNIGDIGIAAIVKLEEDNKFRIPHYPLYEDGYGVFTIYGLTYTYNVSSGTYYYTPSTDELVGKVEQTGNYNLTKVGHSFQIKVGK